MKIRDKSDGFFVNLSEKDQGVHTQSVKKERKYNAFFLDKMNNPSIPVMGYNVYSGKLNEMEFSAPRTVVNTINAHSFVVARKDHKFREALNNSSILIADGFPVVLAAKLLNKHKIYKIAGEDIFLHLLEKLQKVSGSCFFLGSSESTLNKIQQRLSREYPDIKANFYSPPYKQEFSESDNQLMLEKVNSFMPDVLFIGMTAPKQEKWVDDNLERIEAGVICSIGAVFDFYSKNITRPSKFWINLRLEWFIRLVKEPRRLWSRYLISSPRFLKELFLLKAGLKR